MLDLGAPQSRTPFSIEEGYLAKKPTGWSIGPLRWTPNTTNILPNN
jgi:hypothetical protein